MYAVVTGASSGIGREIARQLAFRGYDLIIVARREERLKTLRRHLMHQYGVDVIVKEYDLSKPKNCYRLYKECSSYHVKVLINNAGFGKLGHSEMLPNEDELSMIRTNIIATHLLTKLFLPRMRHGRILNISSISGFQPNPMIAAYGATKSYVLQYSRALNYELRKRHRSVHISVACPGPVATEFDKIANSRFHLNYISPSRCAKMALDGMFKNKELIVPTLPIKLLSVGSKLLPTKLLLPIGYWIQTSKL